jgi:hypothetical protein
MCHEIENRYEGMKRLENSRAKLLVTKGISTFLFDQPDTRNALMQKIVQESMQVGLVVYVDLDTSFTASLRSSRVNHKNLRIILPKGDEVEEALLVLLSWTTPRMSLLVLDSVTIFNQIIGGLSSFTSKNRKLGLYLALLRELSSRASAPMIVTSHWGYKRVKPGADDWTRHYSGGRVLEHHSTNIYSAAMNDEDISIQVMKSAQMQKDEILLIRSETFESQNRETDQHADRNKQ